MTTSGGEDRPFDTSPAGREPGEPFALERPAIEWGRAVRIRKSTLFRLGAYYLLLMVVGLVLSRAFPTVRDALVVPAIPALEQGAELLTGARPSTALAASAANRALTTLLVILGAILLSLPVAWVYMRTKRLRYDPGLVRSVVILPIAVAGILLVVKNSLAIAFSLAGIVAAVRFRNTLKDPQDAVYIFLTIAIGIAAGVSALDVAYVVSITFNVAVLAMARFDVGSPWSGRYARTGVLSFGDSSILLATDPEACRSVRREARARAGDGDMRPDGIVLVHSGGSELARTTVQDALAQATNDWQLLSTHTRGQDLQTSMYLVDLDSKATPLDLMGALDDRSVHILAAEYLPYRTRRHRRLPAEDTDEPPGNEPPGNDAP